MEVGCSGRRLGLALQFKEAALDIIGVQESRASDCIVKHAGDDLIASSASDKGQGGLELWFRKKLGVKPQHLTVVVPSHVDFLCSAALRN